MADESEPPKRELTPKQEAFCQRYTTHWNATRAAKEAGYSADTAAEQGYHLVHNSSVKKRIDEITEHALAEIGVSRQRVLTELSRIAFVSMKDLAHWNESGVRFKPSDEMDPEHAAAIREVSETVNQSGGTLSIRQHDKTKALELLGKHLKLFTEKHEHSGPDGKPIEHKDMSEVPQEELEARLEALLAKREAPSG